MAVLSCTVIGRVTWYHGYAGGYVLNEYQIHKTNTTAITELPGEAQLNVKVLLTCCLELLTQWYVYFLWRFERSVSIHSPTGFTF